MRLHLSIRDILLATLIVGLALGATATAQFPRNRPAPTAEGVERVRKMYAEQAELLAEWDKGEVESLDSKDLAKIISSISDKGTGAVPQDGTKVDLDSLAAETKNDLNNAIVGLIRAYCSELQTTAVIVYMKERNEVPDKPFIDKVRSELLKQDKLSGDDIKQLSDDDVLRFFHGDDIQSHWAGIQINESNIHVWKASQFLAEKTIQDFGREYWAIFPGLTSYSHTFSPKTSLNDESNNNGSVLIADVKLLIRLDDKLLSKPAPYFIRFWFCTADNKWHPFQLKRCLLSSRSDGVNLQF